MESNLENITIITISNPPRDDEPKLPTPVRTRKSKHGPIHVLRVALLMMRGNSKKPSVTNHVDDESNNVWKKFVGSMRPLHLQSNRSPRSVTESNDHQIDRANTLPPPSPCESYGSGSVFADFPSEEEPYSPLPESPPNSRYASAIGLNELVQSDEENERQDVIKEECCDHEEDVDGDEKIDAKAEEFIAQFYKQMKLQRFNNVDRYYQERSERSLGW
ncbi:uncharacterized protein [Cicer arietinum]|uniref:Uncharacterized protein LOC101496512 n=1 Tax=Cicer arietinum TaxID=3827 RepID=A0A1S2XTR7_CICAR|nr:uncharacterized protein LOC101496512 [Cicer arietinum]